MLTFFLPFLQAGAALITIFGFFNAPHVTDTVVTYGATGDNAPQAIDWVQSYGAIAFGIISSIATWIAQRKYGAKSDIYKAVIAYISDPLDKLAALRLFLAAFELFMKIFAGKTPDEMQKDVSMDQYVRAWVMEKYINANHANDLPKQP